MGVPEVLELAIIIGVDCTGEGPIKLPKLINPGGGFSVRRAFTGEASQYLMDPLGRGIYLSKALQQKTAN